MENVIGIGTFKKNVMKTVNVKKAKLGLKVTLKSSNRTAISHAVVSLKNNMGVLMHSMTPYILGMQFSHSMKAEVENPMGDIGADLTVLCRLLKVKMPTSTKKIKIMGTRTAALLTLDTITTSMLSLIEASLFSSPKMTTVKKMVNIPGGKEVHKEEREVQVVDMEAEQAFDTLRMTSLIKYVEAAVDLYWRLCFDIFSQPPAFVLKSKMDRMIHANPHVTFDLKEEEEEADEVPETSEPASQLQTA